MKDQRETEWGTEQFCAHCPDGGEWWPVTNEFWYFNQVGKTNGPCIACQAESRAKLADQPCCIPGCNQPRHQMATRVGSRCLDHQRAYAAAAQAKKPRTRRAVSQPIEQTA